jgi:hypothetical protein
MLMRLKIFSALDFFMRNHSKVVVVLIPELCSSLACVNLPFSFQKGENRFEFAFALLIGLVNSQESSQRRNKRERMRFSIPRIPQGNFWARLEIR